MFKSKAHYYLFIYLTSMHLVMEALHTRYMYSFFTVEWSTIDFIKTIFQKAPLIPKAPKESHMFVIVDPFVDDNHNLSCTFYHLWKYWENNTGDERSYR